MLISNRLIPATEKSSPGMILFVELFQPFPCDMGIDLGRGDIRMPKHGLNRPEIRAVFEQMGRK
jgi:hypothetical protein